MRLWMFLWITIKRFNNSINVVMRIVKQLFLYCFKILMMKRISLLLLLFSIGLSGQILFEDDASIAGLTEHTGSIGNGHGLSFVDYDGDGWDDITLPS